MSSERATVESLTHLLLENAPSQLADMLRLCALPHWLDEGVVSILLPDHDNPGSVLKELQRFRFVTQTAPGQLVYHRQVRESILGAWLKDQPDRFHQLSAHLAQHYYGLAVQPGNVSNRFLPEYIYHRLAAEPSDGITQLRRLFESAVEAYELGLAERLAAMAEERRSLLGEQVEWLSYYSLRLALARYETEPTIPALSSLVETGQDPYLVATVHRALGLSLVQNRQWSEGIAELRRGVTAFGNLSDSENVVQARLSLGDAYRDLAASSGGIYEERRQFTGWIHRILQAVADLPLLIYRQIANRVNAVPKLYGANYQNWIVLRLLRSALETYRQAERGAVTSNDERLKVEVQQRLAEVERELGHHQSAESRYHGLLATPLVQSSPYRVACIGLGIARLELLRNERRIACQRLYGSLNTFTHVGDWRLAGEAGQLLGQAHEAEQKPAEAVDAYVTAIANTTRANDDIRRTELASALTRLMLTPEFSSLEEAQRNKAQTALSQVNRQVFVARFPGQIQRWFTGISAVLSGPVLFIVALSLVVLTSLSLLLAEGSIRNLISANPVPMGLRNSISILLTALVPFYALWIRYVLYVVIGLFVVTFFLPISRIERSKPQTYVLNDSEIIRYTGLEDQKQVISWREIDAVVLADRFAWQTPNPLSSRTFVIAGDQRLIIRGTTHNYQDLQQAIEMYRRRDNPAARPAMRYGFAIVRHWWLGVALGLAGILAALFVLGVGIYSSYCATQYVNGACPNPIRTAVPPWAMWTGIFFVLIFAAGTLVRSINADLRIRRAINKIGRKTPNENVA